MEYPNTTNHHHRNTDDPNNSSHHARHHHHDAQHFEAAESESGTGGMRDGVAGGSRGVSNANGISNPDNNYLIGHANTRALQPQHHHQPPAQHQQQQPHSPQSQRQHLYQLHPSFSTNDAQSQSHNHYGNHAMTHAYHAMVPLPAAATTGPNNAVANASTDAANNVNIHTLTNAQDHAASSLMGLAALPLHSPAPTACSVLQGQSQARQHLYPHTTAPNAGNNSNSDSRYAYNPNLVHQHPSYILQQHTLQRSVPQNGGIPNSQQQQPPANHQLAPHPSTTYTATAGLMETQLQYHCHNQQQQKRFRSGTDNSSTGFHNKHQYQPLTHSPLQSTTMDTTAVAAVAALTTTAINSNDSSPKRTYPPHANNDQDSHNDKTTTATTDTGSQAAESVSKKRKVSTSPHLAQLYRQLEDTRSQLQHQHEEQEQALRVMQEAQERLQLAQQQHTALQTQATNLEEQLLQEELQQDNDFTRHYRLLMEFVQEFGHCNVGTSSSTRATGSPNNNARKGSTDSDDVGKMRNDDDVPNNKYKDLAVWAKKMRRVKTLRERTKKRAKSTTTTSTTTDRIHSEGGTIDSSNSKNNDTNDNCYQGSPLKYYIQALDRIGFVWDAIKGQWHKQFEKMLAFKVMTGHCCVPKAYQPDKSLGAWVHRQRYHYKLYHEGKPTQLTPERIDLLNSVGFSWGGDCTTPLAMGAMPRPTKSRRGNHKKNAQEEWESSFQELVQFKQEHGHVKISSVHDKERNNHLRDWVAWQRREYKKWEKGQPSQMTADRIQRLEDVDFPWEAGGRGKGKANHNNNKENGKGGCSKASNEPTIENIAFQPHPLAATIDGNF